MTTVTLEEARAHLHELLGRLQPGESVTITDRGQPVAEVKKAKRTTWPCEAGTARDRAFWMAPDFDAPLEDLRDHG